MIIEVDRYSGFCFGVINAINRAEEVISKGEELYCLGDIVHNNAEVQRLEEKGMKTIEHDQLKNMMQKKVLIRAHGEPPSTFALAEEKNIQIIDATCPVVLKLQKKVKDCFESQFQSHGQVVIFGKQGHPEVNGLVGQTAGEAIVIGSINEINKLNFSKPICLFSQTTMDKRKYAELGEAILAEMKKELKQENVPFEINNTICGSVSNRVPSLKKFSSEHDVVIFVGGRTSSNGKVLFEICQSVNSKTHFVSEVSELKKEWFSSLDKVGICGATSTPRWQMEQVSETIQEMFQ